MPKWTHPVGCKRALWGLMIASVWAAARPALVAPSIEGRSAASFSGERAHDDLTWVAAAPRPSAGPEIARVRERVQARAQALGWKVAEQRFSGTGKQRGATLTNLIVSAAGRASTGTVVLAAHLDTVPGSPGAADDGSGVAVLLEAMRVMSRFRAVRNDVVFLFTDGEEAHMLGAKHFATNAEASDVRVVINLDAVGGSGPAVPLECGWPRGLMEACRSSGVLFVGSSLCEALYRNLPLKTDFTVFRRQGIGGINLSLLGGAGNYHAATDVAESVDPRSLQHLGDYVVPALRWAADRDFTKPLDKEPVTYTSLPGGSALLWSSRFDLWWAASVLTACVLAGRKGHASKPWSGLAILGGLAGMCGLVTGLWALALGSLGVLGGETSDLAWLILFVTGGVAALSGQRSVGCERDVSTAALLSLGVVVAALAGLDSRAPAPLLLPVALAAGAHAIHGHRGSRWCRRLAGLVGGSASLLLAPTFGLLFLGAQLSAAWGASLLAIALVPWLALHLPLVGTLRGERRFGRTLMGLATLGALAF